MSPLPLHERYPSERIRVVRQGKPSTISLGWDDYMMLLAITPGKSPRVLAKLVREEVRSLEQAGRVKGLSAAAREAVLLRLIAEQTARQ